MPDTSSTRPGCTADSRVSLERKASMRSGGRSAWGSLARTGPPIIDSITGKNTTECSKAATTPKAAARPIS